LANPTATRTGYTFGGWYIDSDFNTPITKIATGSHEDKDIYAKWIPIQTTVTLNVQSGSGGTSEVTAIYGAAMPAITLPTRSGYAFNGYFTQTNGEGTKYYNADGSSATNWDILDATKTLYAYWTVDYCKPYIQLDCKDYNASKVTVHYDADDKATITAYETYAKIISGRAIYLPVALEAGTYNIKVSGRNDGGDVWLNYFTETGSSSNVTYDGAYYSKSGYNNAGQYGSTFEEKSWDGITVSGGNYLFSITGHTDAEYQWIRIYKASGEPFCPTMYEVNFTQPEHGSTSAQLLGGSTLTTGEEVPEGSKVIFTCTPAAGYDFVKFSDGVNNYTQNPCTLTVNSDLTITTTIDVEVTKHELTATVADGQTDWGSVSPASQQVGEGHEANITATPNANYRFVNWTATGITLDDDQKTDETLSIIMPTKNVSLVAHFEFDAVENIIATGESNIGTYIDGREESTITITSVTDGAFSSHNVLSYAYHMGSTTDQAYCGYTIPTDDDYTPNNKATGLAFYYKTDGPVYMEIKIGNNSKVFKLNETSGVWKYAYLPDNDVKTGTNFSIWINYTKDGHTMTSQDGVLYLSEIQATNITSKPDKSSCGTCFPVNFSK